MRNTTIISIITLSLSLVSCGGENESPKPTVQPTPEVKPPAPVVTNTHENISTGSSLSTNSLTIAGITLNVTVNGSIAPNALLDVSIIQRDGVPAAAIRVWVGDASGVGSIKTKAHSHGASSHVHAQAPATLPTNSALWIEVQNAEGSSGSGSIQLN